MATNYNKMTDAELRQLAAQNSKDWHGADSATQAALHQQNVEINKILDSRTGATSSFDSGSGKWSTTGGTKTATPGSTPKVSGSGSSGGGRTGSSGGSKGSSLPYGLDDYGQTDWSILLKDAMNEGRAADYVQGLLDNRVKKALGTDGLQKYAYDDVYDQAIDYIQRKQQEDMFGLSPIYSGRYDRDIDQETDQFRRMSYEDWVNSDAYKALAARYGHLAGIGMDDMLGKLAARTGGLASSYAVSAAQQQYNEYMGRLEEVARQMYDADRDDLLENIGLLQDLDQRDYNRYLGALSQYNTDRNFQYQAGLDRWKQDYQLGRDQISDSRYDQEYADGRLDAAQNDAQSRIDAFLAAGGSATDLDPGLVEQSGYTQVELAALERYYAQQAQAAASKGSSSGRGSGSGSVSSGTGGIGNEGIYQSLYDSGARSEGDAYAYLLASGYNTTQAGKLAGYFATWMDNQKGAAQGAGGTRGGFAFNQADHDAFKSDLYSMKGEGWPSEIPSTGSSSGSPSLNSDFVPFTSMGSKAKQLYGQIGIQWRVNPSAGEKIADEIEAALRSGSITEAEAGTLLGMMGY